MRSRRVPSASAVGSGPLLGTSRSVPRTSALAQISMPSAPAAACRPCALVVAAKPLSLLIQISFAARQRVQIIRQHRLQQQRVISRVHPALRFLEHVHRCCTRCSFCLSMLDGPDVLRAVSVADHRRPSRARTSPALPSACAVHRVDRPRPRRRVRRWHRFRPGCRLSYLPGRTCSSCRTSAARSFLPAPSHRSAAAHRAQPRGRRHALQAVDAQALIVTPFHAVLAAQAHDTLEQLSIAHAGGPRGFGEVLLAREIRIGDWPRA